MNTRSYAYSAFNDFKGWNLTEYLWLAAALLLVGWGSLHSTPLEFFAALTNVVCVILVAKGKISNYYWGLLGVASYAIVAGMQQFYGNMLLNIIYLGFQVWGIIEWRQSVGKRLDTSDQEVLTKRLTRAGLWWVGSIIAIGTLVVWLFLIKINDAAPLLDAFTLVGSLVAMTLMVKRYAEQWVLWIVVNIASIWMWVVPSLNDEGSWAMVAMWSAFLINSLYGAYKWFIVQRFK